MSISSMPILPKNFDINKLSFGEPKALSTGGKSVYVNYAGSKFLFQTPAQMKAPFGVSKWEGENGGPDKYDLQVSFDGVDARPPVRAMFDMLDSLDQHLIEYVTVPENSTKWWKGKKFPNVDVVKELYTPSIKYGKDKDTGEISTKFPPTFKMTLPHKDGKFNFTTYNAAREEVDLMELIDAGRTKGASVQAIVQLTSVWIVGPKFGLSWKVYQLMLSEPAQLTGCLFQRTEEDDDDDDDEEDGNGRAGGSKAGTRIKAEPVDVPTGQFGRMALLQDSDDEANGHVKGEPIYD